MEAKSLYFTYFCQLYTETINQYQSAVKNFTCILFFINIIANIYEKGWETIVIYNLARNKGL